MKNNLLLLILLGLGSLNARAEPEPNPPKMIQVQVEFIELPHKALTKLLFLAKPKTSDSSPLRVKLQEMIDKDEAEILDTQLMICRSSQKARNQSIHEFIYPTEYQAPALPATFSGDPPRVTLKSSIGPEESAIPTAFETRNLGSTLEVEPTFSEDGKFIELRFIPELVWHTGNTIWLETKDALGNVSKVQMPDFYTLRLITAVTCVPGKYLMASVVSPKDANGETDQSRKVMVFVKCEIVTAK